MNFLEKAFKYFQKTFCRYIPCVWFLFRSLQSSKKREIPHACRIPPYFSFFAFYSLSVSVSWYVCVCEKHLSVFFTACFFVYVIFID